MGEAAFRAAACWDAAKLWNGRKTGVLKNRGGQALHYESVFLIITSAFSTLRQTDISDSSHLFNFKLSFSIVILNRAEAHSLQAKRESMKKLNEHGNESRPRHTLVCVSSLALEAIRA